MICPNCQHQNDGGNFCEKCGTKLTANVNPEVAATAESSPQGFTNPVQNGADFNSNPNQYTQQNQNQYAQPNQNTQQTYQNAQPNQYIETTKNVSKQYFGYFINVLKKPYATSQAVGGEHLINGIITMVLYSLFIPLMFYFGLKGILSDINSFGASLLGEDIVKNPPFADVVLKPTFAYLIFIFLVSTFTFAAVKLGRINASFKEVIARFGSFLIPFVCILAIALIMSILKIDFFLFFLLLGFLGSIFIVPPLVIASFKKGTQEGVDAIYGTLITYVLTFIAIFIMADMLFESIKSAVTNLLGDLGGFGGF